MKCVEFKWEFFRKLGFGLQMFVAFPGFGLQMFVDFKVVCVSVITCIVMAIDKMLKSLQIDHSSHIYHKENNFY